MTIFVLVIVTKCSLKLDDLIWNPMITVSGCVFSSAAARNVRHMKSFLLGFGAAQAKFD